MAEVIFDPGFKKPTKPSEALECALHIIRDEQRWASGSLFERLPAKEQKPAAPVCQSVRACSVGALVIAVFDGPAVASQMGDIGHYHPNYFSDPTAALEADEIGGPSLEILGKVIMPPVVGPLGLPYDAEDASSDIIDWNDSGSNPDEQPDGVAKKYCQDRPHLENVIAAFEDAVVAAKKIEEEV